MEPLTETIVAVGYIEDPSWVRTVDGSLDTSFDVSWGNFTFIAIYPKIGGGALDSFFTINVQEKAIL